MAQQIRLIDDIDRHSEAVETLSFSIRGKDYEIDLSAENVEEFDAQMAYWVEYARKAGKPPATVHNVPVSTGAKRSLPPRLEWSDPVGASTEERERYREMRKDARTWALANGWPDLGTTGRVPDAAYVAWKEEMGWTGDIFACWNNQRRKNTTNGSGRNGQLAKVSAGS